MHKSAPVLYKRSLIALAVLSTSACSSIPQVSSIDFAAVSSGIGKAGKVTASSTRETWNTTVKLLGFSDSNERPSGQNQPLADEQLLVARKDVNHVLPIELVPTIKIRKSQRASVTHTPTAVIAKRSKRPTKELIPRASLDQGDEDLLLTKEHLLHEVTIGDNLWNIAKETTGNALNWQVLADINSLSQNASVFPGQQLVIPTSLIHEENSYESEENRNAFKLDVGETLWKFSKRTTGDATNWQAIASHNNFTEKQSVTVYPGQTIYVPNSLIDDDSVVTASATSLQHTTLDAAPSTEINDDFTSANSHTVTIVEASYSID